MNWRPTYNMNNSQDELTTYIPQHFQPRDTWIQPLEPTGGKIEHVLSSHSNVNDATLTQSSLHLQVS